MLPVLLALSLGADLSKIDRSIKKEPAYAGKPKYCLLVFGPEAKTRVWLAVDGETLYVDRNGDSDLTGGGEKVKLPAMEPQKGEWAAATRDAELGSVREGKLTHTDLTLFQARPREGFAPKTPDEKDIARILEGNFKDDVFGVQVRIQGERRFKQSAVADASGVLRFAATPKDAPVIHFNGPWSMGLLAGPKVVPGEKPADLKACVGTPGLGKGTFAAAVYEGLIPADAHPVAEITFPGMAGAKTVTLDQRC
jgi:hypothetical protein